MQKSVWNTCIVTPYRGKRERRFNRCTDACGTHSLWRHTKENAKVVLTYSETHVMKHMHCDAIPVKTRMRLNRRSDACKKKFALTSAIPRQSHTETRVKHMHCDAIPRKTQKEPYTIQSRMWNTCIMMQYRGNAKCVLTRSRYAWETNAGLKLYREIQKSVLTDAETRLKHVHCDAIPTENVMAP